MAAEIVAANLADYFNFEDIFKGGGIFGGGGGFPWDERPPGAGGTFGSGPQAGGAIGLAPLDITAQRIPEAGAVLGGAAESTAAATAMATAITTAGTAAATAFTAAGTTAATALTAAGTTVAAAITTAGTAAAAAIGAAATAGGAGAGISTILEGGFNFSGAGFERGGYVAPGQVALVGESTSRQAAPELLVPGRASPTAALQALQVPTAGRIAGASATGREAPELIRAGPAGITVVPLRSELERREREVFAQRLERHDADSVRLEHTDRTSDRLREWLKERERDRYYFSTHYVGAFEKGGYIPPGKLGTVGDSASGHTAPEALIGGRVDARERPAIVAAAMPLSVARPPVRGRPMVVGESPDGRERPQLAYGGAHGITVIPLKGSLHERFSERLLDRPPLVLPAPQVHVDARPPVPLDRERFAGYFATGGFIPAGRYGVVGDSGTGRAASELLVSGQVSGTQAGQAPTVINQSLIVNAPQGQVSRQTEMQITAAAARGARAADRHNN